MCFKKEKRKSVEAYIHEKVWSNSQQLMIHQTQVLNLMCFTRLYHLWIHTLSSQIMMDQLCFSNEKGLKLITKSHPSTLYYIPLFSLNKLFFLVQNNNRGLKY